MQEKRFIGTALSGFHISRFTIRPAWERGEWGKGDTQAPQGAVPKESLFL
jgi:hypothetical protein